MYTIKNFDDLERLSKLASLQSQVKALGLQNELGKQNLLEDLKKLFEPVTKSIKDVSEAVPKNYDGNL